MGTASGVPQVTKTDESCVDDPVGQNKRLHLKLMLMIYKEDTTTEAALVNDKDA